MIELVTHLADPSDPDQRFARRALANMWRHTSGDAGKSQSPLLADTESQLAHSFFRTDVNERAAESTLMITALQAMTRNDTEALPPEMAPLLQHLSDHVRQREARFAGDMLAIVRAIDPTSTDWRVFAKDAVRRGAVLNFMRSQAVLEVLASTRISSIAAQFGASTVPSELRAMTASLIRHFPTPLFFFRNLLVGLIESGTNFSASKHANSIWDVQLAFGVSPEATVDGKPLVLVTNEKRIHRAATDGGHGMFVMDMQRYRVAVASGSIVQSAAELPPPSA
ncbi:MAG: hypothetical protein ACREOQ_17805 [Gemmatimonadales bacterium]